MVRSFEDYVNSLRDGRVIYYRGKLVSDVTTHEILRAAINHAAELYRWQMDPELKKYLTFDDPQYGTISRFYKVPRSPEDLIERFKLIYNTTLLGRGMFNIMKTIGSDALFGLMIASKQLDRIRGTNYFDRVMRYYERVVKDDVTIAVAQTDVKGDRMLRPHQQEDSDLYVHIVGRDSDGIIVRGAKVHTTQSIAANELIVLPYRNMVKEDADYAVAFALPVNAKGTVLIPRPLREVEINMLGDEFPMGKTNVEVETLTIFDNVKVPNDRVFLAGEYEFAAPYGLTFALYHRFTAISYRAALADIILGYAKLFAEYNDVETASHIRRDIVDIITYKEYLVSSAIASAEKCIRDPNTGICIPNPIYTNVGKLTANAKYLDAVKDMIDVAGGLLADIPSTSELSNPTEEKYMVKYLVGKKGTDARTRIRLFQVAREFLSALGALLSVGMIHAEGSIEASVIELYRSYNYDISRTAALYNADLAKIDDIKKLLEWW
ncbi:4-hydroxybutyryl-CoA dehydratase (abfD-1) [Vulcanisaeta moutnovskia 768-28]|uniref:4-hydroxybutyryl-CoA dehydratase (AbfD-1) n=1 Tax=Vulcanisaeta moutnovskia (strain 768-28) TaxID=985053 RepID=F0QXN4_VULM7|nr:4-hydroxyphenylacetate 3-hydroxylase N-terminal domain-containing protein [Vulcanisaeta moutnovskia]ADY02449.1 4-hydroxybutyryl-CoA dehydratase (abfD-1) [Vulcanisaeta moutnovskia 768-28]